MICQLQKRNWKEVTIPDEILKVSMEEKYKSNISNASFAMMKEEILETHTLEEVGKKF